MERNEKVIKTLEEKIKYYRMCEDEDFKKGEMHLYNTRQNMRIAYQICLDMLLNDEELEYQFNLFVE